MPANNEDTPEEVEEEKKRPNPGAFYQQKLPAWQPVLSAWPVAWLFLVLGIFFLAFGIALFVISSGIAQYTIDYTNCVPVGGSISQTISGRNYSTCADFVSDSNSTGNYQTCTCTVTFNVTQAIAPPAYMYYRLTNYYQNYRRYARSRDDMQLNGQSLSVAEITNNQQCLAPFIGNGTYPYAPCGAVANSLFNDSLTLNYVSSSGSVTVPLLNTGIAWPSDKNVKFNNPASSYWSNSIKPMNWLYAANLLGNSSTSNYGFTNEDLIVWMRTAALPTFRKLYRRVDHSVATFSAGLPAGQYQLNVVYAYPVTSFSGTKSIVLTTSSWVGGRSLYIGIVYLAVGCILLVLSIIFFIVHIKMSKRVSASMQN